MQISNQKVASIHYTLKNSQGEVIDSSEGSEPLTYIQGMGNIIPGLEAQLEGKQAGDKLNAEIAPEDAYGMPHEELIQTVSRGAFDGVDSIEVGMRFQAQTASGSQVVVVVAVDGDQVTLDGNHPLAGERLFFDVEVVEVRDASADELAHGHVHGPGCNH